MLKRTNLKRNKRERTSIGGVKIMGYRQKVEKHIGRKLTDNEIVHHINLIHEDNRIENLRVMLRGEHTTLHRKGHPNIKKTYVHELEGFKDYDIVRIINPKSQNYNKLVMIQALHQFNLKATVRDVFDCTNTIKEHATMSFSLKSLKVIQQTQ